MPGDKSISHRAAIVAAMARGSSRLVNYSTSEDCASTLSCLRQLGISYHRVEDDIHINSEGMRGFKQPRSELDCGNSGTTMRLLLGVLAAQPFESILTGDASLLSRPMTRVVQPLQLMGASVSSKNGRPPLGMSGTSDLKAISYELPVASAQVKSCVLLAGLSAQGRTEVIESLGSTRDHTERLLRWFGVPVTQSNGAIGVDGPIEFDSKDVEIPGDISSAAFFIAAAALLPGSELVMSNVDLNPTRIHFLSLLRSFGLDIATNNLREVCNEPVGEVVVRGISADSLPPQDIELRGAAISQLIDELPLLAVVATQLDCRFEIRDARELRHKESDRIKTTVSNLRLMGAEVEEHDDGLTLMGPVKLRAARLTSFGDHRIAMAFAVAALFATGESEIDEADCVGISFPNFFQMLDTVMVAG